MCVIDVLPIICSLFFPFTAPIDLQPNTLVCILVTNTLSEVLLIQLLLGIHTDFIKYTVYLLCLSTINTHTLPL